VSAEELIKMCRDDKFCPYEVAKAALGNVKVVAASYTYLLDPAIRPMFLRSMHVDLSDLIIVLDEAHNLPDVAMELASDDLTNLSIVAAMREAKEFEDDFAHQIFEDMHELVQNLADKKLAKLKVRKSCMKKNSKPKSTARSKKQAQKQNS